MNLDWRRAGALLLTLVFLLLVLWTGSVVSSRLVQTRSAVLFDAERAIAQATSPKIQQNRVPSSLRRAADELLARPVLGLNYLTLRNANSVVLLSRGGLDDWLDWLPAAQARQARSLLYRLLSAEANRPVMRDEQRIGYARFGAGWEHVLARAGTGLALWFGALLASLGGFVWALVRMLAPTDPDDADNDPSFYRDPSARASVAHLAQDALPSQSEDSAPLSRLVRRSQTPQEEEFVPIAVTSDHTVQETAEGGVSGKVVEIRGQKARTDVPPLSSGKSVAPHSRVHAHPAFEGVAAQLTKPPEFEPFHDAPVTNVQPALGNSTLNLRFFPIWRGRDRQHLAGARAQLVWRHGNGEPVAVDTLAAMAKQSGTLRDFTQWLAQRFSLLHGNWRALELSTVPIVLQVSDLMFGFDDAQTVWRDALETNGRDANDLILGVSRQRTLGALPVRRAVDLESLDDPLPAGRDVLYVHPDHVAGADDWARFLSMSDQPVIVGPVMDADAWAAVIDHARVGWYSDAPVSKNLHTPRTFARLLSRTQIEPI